jgi:NAD(P)-dependent dehydrogenase (short-subunit alcohol dehydrogenase family)
MTGQLSGKTALVTGAATGMGRATALRFAREGARCVVFGLDGALLDETASDCGGIAVHGDITRQADIDAAIEACDGRIDVLVNAAGIIAIDDPLTVADAEWTKTFAVNVTGIMSVCRAALPVMIAGGGGAIVNIASVAAFSAKPGMTSYGAAKAALVSYTRSIAYAHGGDGVRANAVAPGWVRTPMSEMEMDLAAAAGGTSREAEFDVVSRRIALKRIAAPEEIASCCLFLAGPESSFVTGAVLVADGGGRAPVHMRAV